MKYIKKRLTGLEKDQSKQQAGFEAAATIGKRLLRQNTVFWPPGAAAKFMAIVVEMWAACQGSNWRDALALQIIR